MCEERAEKLKSYLKQTNHKELAAWVGLIVQCSQWYPDLNAGSKEMRKLLRKDIPFV